MTSTSATFLGLGLTEYKIVRCMMNNRAYTDVSLFSHSKSDWHTIFLMAFVLNDRRILYPSMVKGIKVTDLCPKRTCVIGNKIVFLKSPSGLVSESPLMLFILCSGAFPLFF